MKNISPLSGVIRNTVHFSTKMSPPLGVCKSFNEQIILAHPPIPVGERSRATSWFIPRSWPIL